MSQPWHFSSQRDANDTMNAAIAGLLSMGALAFRMGELENTSVDKPEIQTPNLKAPQIPLNLGSLWDLSMTADKLIKIIFMLLMVLFIIISTFKGVKLNRKKMMEDLQKGFFNIDYEISGDKKFFLMTNVNPPTGSNIQPASDFPLSAALAGHHKRVPGMYTELYADTRFLASSAASESMGLNAYFHIKNPYESVSNIGLTDPSTQWVDMGKYTSPDVGFGEVQLAPISATGLVENEIYDGSIGSFEFAPKRWYHKFNDGDTYQHSFLFRFFREYPNYVIDEDHEYTYLLPIESIQIEYRPFRKLTSNANVCIFKEIVIQIRGSRTDLSNGPGGTITITNPSWPNAPETSRGWDQDLDWHQSTGEDDSYDYKKDDGFICFNEDYSALLKIGYSRQSEDGAIHFAGFHLNERLIKDGTWKYNGNIEVKYKNSNLYEILSSNTSYNSGILLDNRSWTSAFSYYETLGDDVNWVETNFGIVSSITGMTGNRGKNNYPEDSWPTTASNLSVVGTGFSGLHGWGVPDSLTSSRGQDFHRSSIDFPIGTMTYLKFNPADPEEPRKPIHRILLESTFGIGVNYINIYDIHIFYSDETGKDKCIREYSSNPGVSIYSGNVYVIDGLQLPVSSFGLENKPFYFPNELTIVRNPYSSFIKYYTYDLKTPGIFEITNLSNESVVGATDFHLYNIEPKITSNAEAGKNDYIRAANVNATLITHNEFNTGEAIDTNNYVDVVIATPATLEIEPQYCFTDPPPRYEVGLNKARANLRCDEEYLIEIFGPNYMELKTDDESFAKTYVPDCECGKLNRYFERY